MIRLKTAWAIFRKRWVMHIFISLQLVAAILMTVIMVHSVMLRTKYYTFFKDYFSSNGIFCVFSMMANSEWKNSAPLNSFVDNNDILAYLNQPTGILGCNNIFGYVVGEEDKQFQTMSYSDSIIKNYIPQLKEGRWLLSSNKAKEIEVVVSPNEYGWKVGDTLLFAFYNYPKQTEINVKIVGMLEDGAKIPGLNGNLGGTIDFNTFIYPYTYEVEGWPVMLFSSDFIHNLDTPTKIVQGLFSEVVITYPDDFTEEQLAEERNKLSDMGADFFYDLKDFNHNSKMYIYRQVYNFLPIVSMLLILVAVSSISSSALATREKLKDYAVFYIYGLQWKHCAEINLLQSLIVCGISVFGTVIATLVIHFTELKNLITIEWSIECILAMFIVLLLYLFVSMMMPLIIIGKSTPKEVLTR